MNFQEGMRHLSQEKYASCYLITGEESFLVEQLLTHFLEKAIDPATADFNLHRFQGESLLSAEVISIANTFPVFSSRRMLIVQNADQIKDERGDFLSYLNDPSESTVLVFVAQKLDMRKKLFATLKKRATLFTCPRLYDREIPAWIAQEARQKGLNLSQEAIWFLKEHIGRDLTALQREIEKVCLYAAGETSGSEEEVAGSLVQRVVGGGRSHSIFELTNAVGDKDITQAIRLLNHLLSEGLHPLYILTMLTRQWRQFALARAVLDAGQAESAISKKVPMPPGLFRRFLQQLRLWQSEEIQEAFAHALSADSQLKGGGLSAGFVLEALLLDLCRPANAEKTRADYTLPFHAQLV